MSCIFKYNGQTFQSELALDEYLMQIERFKELSKDVNDVVYSQRNRTSEQISIFNKIYAGFKRASNISRERARAIADPDDEEAFTLNDNGNNVRSSNLSVTDLLHTIRKAGSVSTDPFKDLLFPLYNADNYWGNIDNDYRNGNPPADQVPFVFSNGEPPTAITSQERLDEIRHLFQGQHEEDKQDTTGIWGQQRVLGSYAHAVMRAYFYKVIHKHKKLSAQEAYDLICQDQKDEKNKSYLFSEQDFKRVKPFLLNALKASEQFYDSLIKEFGQGCNFYIEQKVTADIFNTQINSPQTLLGIIDLLVVTPEGKVAIFDYKCSTKDYSEFNAAKKRTYDYQLAIYRKMLQQIGVGNEFEPVLYVVPLKFTDFKFDEKTRLGSISGVTVDSSKPFIELDSSNATTGSNYAIVQNQLSHIFVKEPVDGEKLMLGRDEANEFIKKSFPNWSNKRNMTEKAIQKYIDKHGGIVPDPATNGHSNKFVHTWNNKEQIITGSDIEIYAKLKQQFEEASGNVENYTKSIRSAISKGRKKGTFAFNKNAKTTNESTIWAQNQLSKYATEDYTTLFENADEKEQLRALDELGIIGFQNVVTGQYDFIKISSSWDLSRSVNMGSSTRHNLLGTFMPDIVSQNLPKALSMDAVEGNVELMQVMAIINSALKGKLSNTTAVIGNIQVMNPKSQEGMSASNARLLYNFDKLCGLTKYQNNYAGSKNPNGIRLASYVDLAYNRFTEIIKSNVHNSNIDRVQASEIPTAVNKLQAAWETTGDKEALLNSLMELKLDLENTFNELKSGKLSNEQSELEAPQYILYAEVMEAILEVSNIDTQQQITDHGKYFEGILSDVLKNPGRGWNGSNLDNPGTLQSETLNKISELCTRAYQQTRDRLLDFNTDLRKEVTALARSKGFNDVSRYTFGNKTDLYQNMFDPEAKKIGNLKFKNPWTHPESMTAGEVRFLKFAILHFAQNTNPKIHNEADLQAYLLNDELSEQYLNVPLAHGTFGSKLSSAGGFIKYMCKQFTYLNPKHIYQRLKDKFFDIYDKETTVRISANGQWEMPNSFDKGNKSGRSEYISKVGGIDFFEQNLETLLLEHSAVYTIKERMDKVFPLIKALYVHLQFSGIIRNQKFENDISYLQNFVKAKIFNVPIDNVSNWAPFLTIMQGELMTVASKISLCFNPRQTYQFIDGLWKDISLMWRKPTGDTSNNGQEPFNRENFVSAIKWISKDLIHFGDSISLGEALNMLYGINDMDMNSLAKNMTSDKVGLFNFWDLGFRFASRPDYYNRMAIFSAQMRADGCWDAHSMKDGKLVYDWKLDKRFNVYANDPHNTKHNPLYEKQKALYYAIATEFESEGALDLDGNPFKFNLESPTALPRAYTNKQSESLKALSDKLYGYYSHEKKSMIQSYSLGGLIMQMATYWSSKKNQWLAGTGYTQEGYFTPYVEEVQNEDGSVTKKQWYLQQDENGQFIPTDSKVNAEGKENIPYMIWKGRPQEGILVTCMRMGHDLMSCMRHQEEMEGQNAKTIFNSYWNSDNPDLRRMYRANLKQLIGDLLALLLLGGLVSSLFKDAADEQEKETGNKSLANAVINNSLVMGASIFKSSTDDFNPVSSIFGKSVEWTPFSISKAEQLATTTKQLVCGDKDSYDAMTKSFAATNSNRPIMDYVKLNLLGREIGQKADDV